MKIKERYLNYAPHYILGCIFLLTAIIYWPGLYGGFLFDDYPNLSGLSNIETLENIKNFVFSGSAGPSGRPISLLSFALQAQHWLENPFKFKLINLIIHLVNGLFLYWATRLLLRSYGYAANKIEWIALISTSIWLIHPFFVSTTLYVIQRMAQLPLLFSLMGIIGYLKGRSCLKKKSSFAYSIMTISIVFFTILSTYSKENGALLPLLILIIEFCNPQQDGKPVWQWRAVCLWLPSLVIAILLIGYIDFSIDPWPNRNFNQIERLWSESRILCDYLYQLFLPKIEGHGLFQDGYLISRSWFQPITTIWSSLFIVIILFNALFFIKKYPLFSLAILFFFSAHLIESTFIGLELYFEHRNYLAAIFLFLPLSAGIVNLSEKIDLKLVIGICLILLMVLIFMTWQRTNLWSNTEKLQIYWAQKNPDSTRAQVNFSQILWKNGYHLNAINILENALIKNSSPILYTQLLRQKIEIKKAQEVDFSNTKRVLTSQKIDGEVIWQIRWLVDSTTGDHYLSNLYSLKVLNILKDLPVQNPSYDSNFPALILFLQGQLYASVLSWENAQINYKKSIELYNDPDASLAIVADCANRGNRVLALSLLAYTESVYHRNFVNDMGLGKKLNGLQRAIQNDL